jgi:DNA invertase Pin-like site-specific DNA recombinase
MSTYIYARVSTKEQNVTQQLKELAKYKPDYEVSETFSGTTTDRPRFNKLLSDLKKGDTLVVREVSRLGRKTAEVLMLVDTLKDKGVRLVVDNLDGLDLTSQAGKLVFTMLAGLAEMERELMLERQAIGIARAQAEGKYTGRKAIDPIILAQAKELIAKGMTKAKVAKHLKIGESTLYKYLSIAS